MAKTLLEKTKELILKTTGEFAPADIKLLGSKSVRTKAIKVLIEDGTLTKQGIGKYVLTAQLGGEEAAAEKAEEAEEAEECTGCEEAASEKKPKKDKKAKKAKKAKKSKSDKAETKSGYEVFLNGEFLMHCDSEDVVQEQFGHNNNIAVQGDKILITARSGDKG